MRKPPNLSAVNLIERLHHQFLEVVKGELVRLGVQDISNVQAIILFNIAAEEVTVGELTHRGYYLGSNVSYNLKKMVEHDYLIQERPPPMTAVRYACACRKKG
jgi:DNA-binding MarR family transcriptional regulator